MLIDLISGTRPNFVKIASLIKAKEKVSCSFNFRLIHTGQHYDDKLSKVFFKELGIPEPDINLNVGSKSHASQVGHIMIEYEKILTKNAPRMCIVVGDVNSTMACAITAKKSNIDVAHVEGGIRSNDLTMPEEINRIVTDSISDYFFTTSQYANENLLKHGISDNKIFYVGNTMIDTLLENINKLKKPLFFDENKLNKNYLVLTMHRPANVDSIEAFEKKINVILKSSQNLKVIFPVHPRTKKSIKFIKNISNRLICIDPLPYLEFNYLVMHSLGVITDSGGITEEASVLKIPCLTMRDNTERPETIEVGTNVLVGSDPKDLSNYINKMITNNWKKSAIPDKWDGKTGYRIIKIIDRLVQN